jgi:hypothetical protein
MIVLTIAVVHAQQFYLSYRWRSLRVVPNAA